MNDPGNLFCVTDQRGERWYVAAPSPEKAGAWLRENGRDTSLVQNSVPIHIRTVGRLAAIVEPGENGTPDVLQPVDRRST